MLTCAKFHHCTQDVSVHQVYSMHQSGGGGSYDSERFARLYMLVAEHLHLQQA